MVKKKLGLVRNNKHAKSFNVLVVHEYFSLGWYVWMKKADNFTFAIPGHKYKNPWNLLEERETKIMSSQKNNEKQYEFCAIYTPMRNKLTWRPSHNPILTFYFWYSLTSSKICMKLKFHTPIKCFYTWMFKYIIFFPVHQKSCIGICSCYHILKCNCVSLIFTKKYIPWGYQITCQEFMFDEGHKI